MYPVALTFAELLNARPAGVAVELDSSMLPRGFCDFLLAERSFLCAIYRIIHECTGSFALLVLIAPIGLRRLIPPRKKLAACAGQNSIHIDRPALSEERLARDTNRFISIA